MEAKRCVMEAKRCVDETEPAASVEPGLADFHRMQLPVDVPAPKIQEPLQFGKFRGKIQFLPDEALQHVGVIR